MNLAIGNNTMSSREIAELTGSSHEAVKKSAVRLSAANLITSPLADTPYTAENKQTYYEFLFNKRDSFVVVARLSPEFTAAVVDRWQELESAVQTPAALPDFSNPAAAARAWAEQYEISTAAQEQLQLAAPKIEYHDKVLSSDNGLLTTEIASEFNMSAIALNRILEAMKVQRKVGGRWVLTAGMLGQGLTVEDTHIDESGKTRHSMKWTEAGRKLIHELVGEK